MTKQQIQHYLRHGCRATHEYFDNKEWVRQEGNQMIIEDGAKIHIHLFWSDRRHPSWEDGWSVVADTNDEVEKMELVGSIPDDKHYYPKPKQLVFDIETSEPSLLLQEQSKGRQQRFNKWHEKLMLNSYFGHVNLIKGGDGNALWCSEKFPAINFKYSFFHQQYKDLMDNAKKAPPFRRIICAEKAREITHVNSPEGIKEKISEDLQKAITNAALKGENRVTFKSTIPNYRYYIHELLIAGKYTFSGVPSNYDEIHISWKIDLDNVTKSIF